MCGPCGSATACGMIKWLLWNIFGHTVVIQLDAESTVRRALESVEVRPAEFNVLQIRPISADSLSAKVDWSQIDESGAWLSSENALGIGKIDDVRDVIYLRSEAFSVLRTREMADTIREWNSRMRQEERGYLLIGHGRWGSSIPSLGVPVEWSDISEARAIVEAARLR